MRTSLFAALAAVGLAGCSLTIDPNGVKPPVPKQKAPVLGACIGATGGHKLCGGTPSAGALSETASASHKLRHGIVDAGGAADISGTNHRIVLGVVSP